MRAKRFLQGVSVASTLLFALAVPPAAPATNTDWPPLVATGAQLVERYQDDAFFEGPTWDPATGKLYVTAFFSENQQILRLDGPGQATVWADHTSGINGTVRSLDGRLLGAQAYGHRITDYGFGPDGPESPRILYEDAALNQPNDLCQTPSGDIYFSDPNFGAHDKSAVYLLRDGKATKVVDDMAIPNGLIAALDGKTLYVGDSHRKHWRAYPVLESGLLGEGRTFFDPETDSRADPDGMTIDAEGNLYLTGRGGVWIVSPAGESLGFIPVPEFCSNVTFGGERNSTLFFTCQDKVYALEMQVQGGHSPPPKLAAEATPLTTKVLAQLDIEPEQIPRYDAYRTLAPLQIDGRLDEPSWQLAARTERFVDLVSGGRTIFDTRGKILWDDTYLYIGFTVEEPLLKAKFRRRDAPIYNDNDVEVFVAGPDAYYEFEINSFGTIYEAFFVWEDAYKRRGFADDPQLGRNLPGAQPFNGVGFRKHPRGKRIAFLQWDLPDLQAAVHLDGTINEHSDRDRGWTVELALPWQSMRALTTGETANLPPADGDVWRIDLFRFNQFREAPPAKDSGGWSWSQHAAWDSHIPEVFPRVRMVKQPVTKN